MIKELTLMSAPHAPIPHQAYPSLRFIRDGKFCIIYVNGVRINILTQEEFETVLRKLGRLYTLKSRTKILQKKLKATRSKTT